MLLRSFMLAVVVSSTAVVIPAFAQDEQREVSDAVDKSLWCGSAFTLLAQDETGTDDDRAAAEQLAEASFEKAVIAMEEDEIDESEHDQLINFYVEQAYAQMGGAEEDARFSAEECVALANE